MHTYAKSTLCYDYTYLQYDSIVNIIIVSGVPTIVSVF